MPNHSSTEASEWHIWAQYVIMADEIQRFVKN